MQVKEKVKKFCDLRKPEKINSALGGEENHDVCTGDGGSHLACSIPGDPDHFYLAGMVAGGIGCGERNVPGFYAEVSKYRKWVDKKLSTLGIATDTYSYE